jgi:hypothetical protein
VLYVLLFVDDQIEELSFDRVPDILQLWPPIANLLAELDCGKLANL